MSRRLPTMVLALGLAGLIPFVAFGYGAVSGADDDRAARFASGLIAYGAVILAFLGGVHWGFVIDEPEPDGVAIIAQRERYRLVFGVSPSLVGWAALLVLLMLGWPKLAIAILLGGFVATTAIEAALTRGNLMPGGYMLLRWVLSAVVVLVLGVVLALLVLGTRLSF